MNFSIDWELTEGHYRSLTESERKIHKFVTTFLLIVLLLLVQIM